MGRCPVCGELRRLNAGGRLRAHGWSGGAMCPGLHQQPGPQVTVCPRPDKVRFATFEAAWRCAGRGRPAVAGVAMRPYRCNCGWVHLTSQLTPWPDQDGEGAA